MITVIPRLVIKSYDTSRCLFVSKIGLEDNKCRKMTRPDFPVKIRIIQKSRKCIFADFATLDRV